MKNTAFTFVSIFVMSLAIWVFFDIWSTRLNEAETTVVVGFCLIVVFSLKWLWARFRNREE